MTKKEFVKNERLFTVELLKQLKPEQWKAKTLCAGWSIEDLAAHLVSRERNIIGGIGLVVPSLQQLHDKRLAKVVARGHEYIIEKLQKYPWYMPASVNVAEFWVHNEDMLRGDLQLSRLKPTKDENKILWDSLNGLVKVKKSMVSDIGNVDFINSENKETLQIKFKRPGLKNSPRPGLTLVSGTAGELLLWFYGRRDAANVTIKNNG